MTAPSSFGLTLDPLGMVVQRPQRLVHSGELGPLSQHTQLKPHRLADLPAAKGIRSAHSTLRHRTRKTSTYLASVEAQDRGLVVRGSKVVSLGRTGAYHVTLHSEDLGSSPVRLYLCVGFKLSAGHRWKGTETIGSRTLTSTPTGNPLSSKSRRRCAECT
jgi:hypothetical protein